jgi:hypothetical protein
MNVTHIATILARHSIRTSPIAADSTFDVHEHSETVYSNFHKHHSLSAETVFLS